MKCEANVAVYSAPQSLSVFVASARNQEAEGTAAVATATGEGSSPTTDSLRTGDAHTTDH